MKSEPQSPLRIQHIATESRRTLEFLQHLLHLYDWPHGAGFKRMSIWRNIDHNCRILQMKNTLFFSRKFLNYYSSSTLLFAVMESSSSFSCVADSSSPCSRVPKNPEKLAPLRLSPTFMDICTVLLLSNCRAVAA